MDRRPRKRRGPIGWLAARSWPFWFVAGIAAVFAAFPAYIIWSFGGFRPPDVVPKAFDSVAWQEAKPIGNYRTVRSQMVDDLIRRRLLNGLTRSEVEQLLGPPLADPQQAGADTTRWHFVYYVGLERAGAWSLDDELFVIQFDGEGRVKEYGKTVN